MLGLISDFYRHGGAAVWRLRLMLVLWRGKPASVLACVADWLLAQPDHPHALATQAHWLAQTNDLEAAEQVFKRLLVLQPHVATHWFNAGFVLQSMGQWWSAQSHLEVATQLDPTLDRAWYGLGVVRIAQGDRRGAELALRRNTELQPMNPLAWYQLAHLHRECGEHQQANALLDHLRGFEPRVARQLEREWSGQVA